METQEPWVCMSDIATYLGVTSETVRNWIKQRDLPGKKMGGRWKFRMSEVEEWAENVRPPTRRNPKPEQLEAYAPSLIMGDCLEQCLLRACPMMIPRVADTHSTRCR